MGLYGFKARFVPAIMVGSKTHTIRSIRANRDKPGSVMHLYTGLRQPGAKLLMRVPCVKVEDIHIAADGFITIDGVILAPDEREQLAKRDGFADFIEMMQFWDGRLPFSGHIYHWRCHSGQGPGK